METPNAADLARLMREIDDFTARRDIHRAVFDYARGQDRLQPELQRQAFHDDAFVDCGTFAGGPDAYVDYAQSALAAIGGSQHMVGQIDLRIDGDRAYGEVYLLAWHRITEDGEEKDMLVGARYIDEYAKRDGQWRILKRREVMDWSRTDPVSDTFLKDPLMHLAGRRGADFSEKRDWPD